MITYNKKIIIYYYENAKNFFLFLSMKVLLLCNTGEEYDINNKN